MDRNAPLPVPNREGSPLLPNHYAWLSSIEHNMNNAHINSDTASTVPDGEAIWRTFEVHRRSAAEYLDEYLRYNEEVSIDEPEIAPTEEDPATVTDSVQAYAPKTPDVVQARLKVSGDMALSDLLVMEDIVSYVRDVILRSEKRISKTAAIVAIICTIGALTIPSKFWAVISAFGAIMGFLAMGTPWAWRKFQERELLKTYNRLRDLRVAMEETDGQSIERDRAVLDERGFRTLSWTLETFWVKRVG
ncbi:hypothetical protein QBC38DRAFT_485328 [Podospora fimiseda]|uniref:Uncharacterized protein n=1 Tax=Podospora fimiseda TaxID=252190 RepID=A0AAN7H004_9PEZI|nr:hypothetical protein QBC38DRAFT_485328 [Podospora fimiseda]